MPTFEISMSEGRRKEGTCDFHGQPLAHKQKYYPIYNVLFNMEILDRNGLLFIAMCIKIEVQQRIIKAPVCFYSLSCFPSHLQRVGTPFHYKLRTCISKPPMNRDYRKVSNES